MLVSNITKNRIKEYLAEGKRFDNRKLMDWREISIETGISKNAEGSARVKIGKTEVIAGVKMGVSEPYTDSEESGTLVTSFELLPLSSSKYEPGPPKIESIEMARIVDRGIRESKFIDFEKLCIKKGEKVWSVFVDIYSINDDGNLIDAAGIAAVAALKSARMPKYDEKDERVLFGEFTTKGLPLTDNIPLLMTIHKIGNHIFIDPIVEEEESSEARVSIEIANGRINALQKGNESLIEIKELFKMFDAAEKMWKEMHAKIEELIERAIKKEKK